MRNSCSEWNIHSFETSAMTGWNVNSAFYCAIYQVLQPCLEIVKQIEVASAVNPERLSQVIEESYKKQDPSHLVKTLPLTDKSASMNLSSTQLQLIRTMTVDSMLENDQKEQFSEDKINNTATSGKSRQSENISLTRTGHAESFHSRKYSKDGKGKKSSCC